MRVGIEPRRRKGTSSRAQGAALLTLTLLLPLGGCAGDPQPAPGSEPPPASRDDTPRAGGEAKPAPSPARVAGGESFQPLRYEASEHGLLIRDPVSGFSMTTPGVARPAPGGGEGALAYELQAKGKGWSLRIRREATPPGRDAREQAETLVYARALSKPVEVAPFRPGTCQRWGVEAAAAGTYPLGKGEAWERVLVLLRGQRALVLWETVDASLGRGLITELNARFYASFRWGGSPRVMQRAPSPYLDARAELTARGERLAQSLGSELPADDLARAEALLGSLAYSAVDPPDEPLHARDRAAIEEKLGGLGAQAAKRLRQELGASVRTPRDLRGLHQVVEAALR